MVHQLIPHLHVALHSGNKFEEYLRMAFLKVVKLLEYYYGISVDNAHLLGRLYQKSFQIQNVLFKSLFTSIQRQDQGDVCAVCALLVLLHTATPQKHLSV